MYKPYKYLVSHVNLPNQRFKKLTETKYAFLRHIYGDKNWKVYFEMDEIRISISNINGVGLAKYEWGKKERKEITLKKHDISYLFGILSLVTYPLAIKDDFFGIMQKIPHNNILAPVTATKDLQKLTVPKEPKKILSDYFSFYPQYSISPKREVGDNNYCSQNLSASGFLSWYPNPSQEITDKIFDTNPLLFKQRVAHDRPVVKSKLMYSHQNYSLAVPPDCGSCGGSSSSMHEVYIADEHNCATGILIGNSSNFSSSHGDTIYLFQDGGCTGRFSPSERKHKSHNIGLPLEINLMADWCADPDFFYTQIALDKQAVYAKINSYSNSNYDPSGYLRPTKTEGSGNSALYFGNKMLYQGTSHTKNISYTEFTSCGFEGQVCGKVGYGYDSGCMGSMCGNAPWCFRKYSASIDYPNLATHNTNVLVYDYFGKENIENYAIFYTLADIEIHSEANPLVTCVDCPGYFDTTHCLCYDNGECHPISEYYVGVPAISGQASEWSNVIWGSSVTTYKTYLDIDGSKREVAKGIYSRCGNRREGYYNIITSGTYIYETFFRDIGAWTLICFFFLAQGICDYLFRDTPRVEYYDLSNTVYKNYFSNIVTYSYILIEAHGCNISDHKIKEYVIGYKLTGKNEQEDIIKEEKYHVLDKQPSFDYEILEGTGGQMRLSPFHIFDFFITASNPFYTTKPVEIKINDTKLDTPNGGIKFSFDYPNEAITSYAIYTWNMNNDGVVDQDNPFQLLKVISNTGGEQAWETTNLYPQTAKGISTNIFYEFQLDQKNYLPILLLDTNSEMLEKFTEESHGM